MAASFITLGSFATVQVTGPQTAVDVLRISFETIPSGVVAYAYAPYRNIVGVNVKGNHITPDQVQRIALAFIAPLADGIERMMASGYVETAVAAEDADRSGLLVDYIDATVSFTPDSLTQPGPFETVVRIRVQAFEETSFYGALVGQPIADAYAAMQTLAGV